MSSMPPPIRCDPGTATSAAARAPSSIRYQGQDWPLSCDSWRAANWRAAYLIPRFAVWRDARHGRGRLRRRGSIPVHDRVEDHVELPMVLPTVNRIVGEHQDASVSVVRLGNVDGERTIAKIVTARHEPA